MVRRLRTEISAAGNPPACLATVLISGDPRDLSNARRKHVHAEEAGMQFRHVHLSPRSTQVEVERAIDDLANDPGVHGIFVQLPLPPQLDRRVILNRIPVEKDVDGLGARSLARLARGDTSAAPATPRGIVGMLSQNGIHLLRAVTVIVGNSIEIALPLEQLLRHESKDGGPRLVSPDVADLASKTRQADIVVSCAERPHLIGAQHIRPGTTVVDAGYNRTKDGVVGDVDVESVMGIAGALVPLPGGIGPATIAILLEKTWESAQRC